MSRVHRLKTLPQYMERISAGQKNFEVRKNDRDFQVGDILHLEYYNPHSPKGIDMYSTPWIIRAEVKYILHGGQFGIELGYCVMGIQLIS